jgi:polysaccharide export outer membrane protein
MHRTPRDRLKASRFAVAALLAWVAVSLPGCGTQADSLPDLPTPAATGYLLGPGDQLRIDTFGDQSLSGEFRVSDNGSVSLPLLGSVKAAGLTTDGLAQALRDRLKKDNILEDPKIAAEVVTYRPIFILGEVSKPGQYPYQPGMTVVTAVAVAGGFTYRAVTDAFSVVRGINGKTVEGRAGRETEVRPGDVITVYERFL